MWKSAVVLLALVCMATSQTAEYRDQTIDPSPLGGSFSTSYNGDNLPNMVSYLISVKSFQLAEGALLEPPKVSSRLFLGNSQFAGFPVVWTNSSVNGDWTNLKHFVAIDPCVGTQDPYSFAWVLVDPQNLTLVADVAVASSPVRVLKPGVGVGGDASSCLSLSTPMTGNPSQCDQFFAFDFSENLAPSVAGYRWSFTITSTNGNPLPFSKAVVAGGSSCPSHIRGGEDSWLELALDPRAPGNSPTNITLSSLMIGTQITKWWIQLIVPEEPISGQTPYVISAQYHPVVFTPPTESTPPSEPISTPSTDTPVATNPTPAAKKPLPLWAIIVISATCIILAAGSLIWVWRLTRQKDSNYAYDAMPLM
jgi:hypothetical protein